MPGADGSGFPAEHLPWGVVSCAGGAPAVAVRIGDHVLDVSRLAAEDPSGLGRSLGDAAAGPTLNRVLALGPPAWGAARRRLTELLCDPRARPIVEPALTPVGRTVAHLPVEVADYVDFYSSLEHATNLGRMFRPDGDPLLPNWRHLPVGYHGRAGTVVASGTPVRRPVGQTHAGGVVTVGPTRELDIELELGAVVGRPSVPGRPVATDRAADHVFGVALVNDWSARDIQAWEYQPLGPFLGKSFATTLACWVTPLDALAGARAPGPRQEPPPAGYLALDDDRGLAIDLSVSLIPAGGTVEHVISRTTTAGLYWRLPQLVAHLTVNGAHLRTGDLLASGTVSGPDRGSEGSLIELTRRGATPLEVGGERRTFLEDGDTVVLRGSAQVADGVTITLGEARGTVVPALAPGGGDG